MLLREYGRGTSGSDDSLDLGTGLGRRDACMEG